MFWQLMSRGGPIMWLLLVCSLVALTVAIERAWFWRVYRRHGQFDKVVELFKHVHQGRWKQAQALGEASADFVVRSVWLEVKHHRTRTDEILISVTQTEFDRMSRYLPVLDSVVTVAPLLGILGTVAGIIQSFELLGVAGLKDPSAVTSGIAQALITTAAGLVIAIPTVLAYNYFSHRATRSVRQLERQLSYAALPAQESGPAGPEPMPSPLSHPHT